jgi:hypothetical protein
MSALVNDNNMDSWLEGDREVAVDCHWNRDGLPRVRVERHCEARGRAAKALGKVRDSWRERNAGSRLLWIQAPLHLNPCKYWCMARLPVTAPSKASLQWVSLTSLLGAAVLHFPSYCKGWSWSRLSDKGLCPDCNRLWEIRDLGEEETTNLRGVVWDLQDESPTYIHIFMFFPPSLRKKHKTVNRHHSRVYFLLNCHLVD